MLFALDFVLVLIDFVILRCLLFICLLMFVWLFVFAFGLLGLGVISGFV